MSIQFPNYSTIDPLFLSPISAEAKEYLDAALQLMEKHSIRKNSICWMELRSRTIAKAQGAQTPSETYDAIRFALELIEDNHSFLWEPEIAAQTYSGHATDELSPEAKLLEDHMGYIFLPGNNQFGEAANEYATTLQDLIRQLDSPKIDGWVIDLRKNEGGHMWPMIAGLGPFFEDTNGAIGSFIDESKEQQKWYYRKGQALCEDTPLCTVAQPYQLINPHLRTAVLLGSKTMSSGEAIALALRHQNSKSFGENTAGLSTCNCSHPLKDGAVLWLTQSYFTDRTNNVYGKEIKPDVTIQQTDSTDTVLQAALKWLNS